MTNKEFNRRLKEIATKRQLLETEEQQIKSELMESLTIHIADQIHKNDHTKKKEIQKLIDTLEMDENEVSELCDFILHHLEPKE